MKVSTADYTDYKTLVAMFGSASGKFHYTDNSTYFVAVTLATAPPCFVMAVLSSQPATFATDYPLSTSINPPQEIAT